MNVVALLVLFLHGSKRPLEKRQVLLRYCKAKVYTAVGVTHIFLSFNQMLGQRGANFVFVAMEQKHALRLLAVIQTFRAYQPFRSLDLVIRLGAEDSLVVEGELLYVLGQFLYRLRFQGIYVLEHSRCSSRCRNKLAPTVDHSLIVIFDVLVKFFICRSVYSITYTSGFHYVELGKTLFENVDLLFLCHNNGGVMVYNT